MKNWPDTPTSLTTKVAQWRYHLKVNCVPLSRLYWTAKACLSDYPHWTHFAHQWGGISSTPPVHVVPTGGTLSVCHHQPRPPSHHTIGMFCMLTFPPGQQYSGLTRPSTSTKSPPHKQAGTLDAYLGQWCGRILMGNNRPMGANNLRETPGSP